VATVEVEEAELEAFKKGMALLQQLSTGKDTRRPFQNLLKSVVPDMQTDDDVAMEYARPVQEKLDALTTEFADYRKTQSEQAAERDNLAALAALNDKFSQLRKPLAEGGMAFSDEGIEKLKQHMIDTGTPDPMVAAAHYVSKNPPAKIDAAPPPWEPDSFSIRSNAVEHDVEGLFKDETKWADTVAANVLNEFQSAA
jgi:hypothetical protein